MARHPAYAIGIDLGTSNCALAYSDLRDPSCGVRLLEIPQYETTDRMIASTMLPSYIYYPRAGEMPTPITSEDGATAAQKVVGVCARTTASQQPKRVIHSAKSWLCHRGIDRESKLLPWQSDEIPQQEKVSPVEASALLLEYLRSVWDTTIAAHDPFLKFNNQQIVITVPASFDQDAQRLTLDAAYMAGYPRSVRLLEEPQAAFHAWLAEHPGYEALRPEGDADGENSTCQVLVCDIGGGTTDLTLFTVTFPADGPPQIERKAVSEHILLGGDNIDIALAHLLEARLSGGEGDTVAGRAAHHLRQSLVNRGRELKEKALATGEIGDETTYTVSFAEDGASLFSETRQAVIGHHEILNMVTEGFFPNCAPEDRPHAGTGGLRETGLPYASDPAATRHIADFLSGHLPVDVVLFNGGTFTPPFLRERVTRLVAGWQEGKQPVVLDNGALYHSVARGAAWFAKEIALGASRLIHAGASHGYYLEIVPKEAREANYLVCILPMGTDIEMTCQVAKLDLHLLVNRPVEFKPYSTVKRTGDHTGQILKYNEREFSALPLLQTVARLDTSVHRLHTDSVPVKLETRLNALGLLQVALVSMHKEIKPVQHWRLEFNIRGSVSPPSAPEVPPLSDSMRVAVSALLASRFDQSLLKKLEAITGTRKDAWNPAWLREFWKPLGDTVARRQQGEVYEAAWLNAAGFFLRPGYGVVLDDYRMDQLWAVYDLDLAYPSIKSVREQCFIMWRRVSGGLDAGRQEALYHDVQPLLASQVKQAAEAYRMAASFELLSLTAKKELYHLLIEGVVQKKTSLRGPYLWSLGRLLGRIPLYGGEETVLSPDMVEECFAVLKDLDWREPGMEYTGTLFALSCRKTARRELDISQEVRDEVAEKMRITGTREVLLRQVIQYLPVENDDFRVIYGESLPSGLTIREFS